MAFIAEARHELVRLRWPSAAKLVRDGRALRCAGFAFEFVTLVPQPFWLLMVLLPNWKGTRLLFEPIQPIAVLSLLHLLIVVLSTQGTPETGTAPLDELK